MVLTNVVDAAQIVLEDVVVVLAAVSKEDAADANAVDAAHNKVHKSRSTQKVCW